MIAAQQSQAVYSLCDMQAQPLDEQLPPSIAVGMSSLTFNPVQTAAQTGLGSTANSPACAQVVEMPLLDASLPE